MPLWLTIIIILGTAVVCFVLGLRYALTRALPGYLAGLTNEEMQALAAAAAKERPDT
jgi:hypothetical protein